METKIALLIFYIVVLIICAVVAFLSDMFKTGTLCVVFVVILGFVGLVCADSTVASYYLPCEIVAVNETSTYFGTVDQDTTQIYAVETADHDWPNDVPYLLHMDSMGTKDVTDDEVLMVWRAD